MGDTYLPGPPGLTEEGSFPAPSEKVPVTGHWGMSDKGPDIQEPNTFARRLGTREAARAEVGGEASSAFKRKETGGRHEVGIRWHRYVQIPDAVLLCTCLTQACETVCVPGADVHSGCSRLVGAGCKAVGALAWALETMDRVHSRLG